MTDSALATEQPGSTTGCPTDPAAYPVVHEVRPRYSDLGPDGTVDTVGLARWFEEARVNADVAGFRRLTEEGAVRSFRVLLAAQRVERLAPMTWGATYRIGIGIRRIGGSSFTYGYAVFAGEECVATGDTVTVFATGTGPTPLPDSLREDLGAMTLDGAEVPPATTRAPERRTPSAYPFGADVRCRLGDIDTNRHVNNVALVGWYADAVAELHLDLLGDPVGGPPPEIAPTAWDIQYVAEVTYPATYRVGVMVERRDDGTLGYACGLFAGERCVGLADAVGERGSLDDAAPDRWTART